MRDIERFDMVSRLRYYYHRRDIMLKEPAMSNISSLFEFGRNRVVPIDKPKPAQGPTASMCNRGANVASMDDASFDWKMSIVENGRRCEMVTHQGLTRGCADLYEGKTSDARDVLDSIRAKNCWSRRSQS